MRARTAAILLFLDSLKAAARSHTPRWNWRFEPYMLVSAQTHQLFPPMHHGYLLRARTPPTINGMQMSAKAYYARLDAIHPNLPLPFLICKTPNRQLRGIQLKVGQGHNIQIAFWCLDGYQNADKPIHRWGHRGRSYLNHKYRQFYPSRMIVTTRSIADRIELQLDIADEQSFEIVSQQCLAIMHKSYGPTFGVGKSLKTVRHHGLAVVMDDRNYVFDPYLHGL